MTKHSDNFTPETVNQIKISEINDGKFERLRNYVENIEFSPFAKFMYATTGYKFVTKKGGSLDKWEVFSMGYTNIDNLLAGKYPVIAIEKR